MLVNAQNLDLAFKGFQTVYRESYDKAPTFADKVAMTIPSSSRDETYGWIGQFPNLREWIGPRHVQNLSASAFTIVNRKFESTVKVGRDSISDDKLGLFKPMFAEMGLSARQHPDQMIFELLASGFASACYDGQNFFDSDHPVVDKTGATVSVSNSGGGSGTPWFLLDTSRSVRPIIWQVREGYEFQSMDRPGDPNVFLEDEYIYGIRARVNAGFGLWQLAYGSQQTLDATNYAAARAAMRGFTSDGGRPLGTMPTLLIVPPSLEAKALALLNTETKDGGESNVWKQTAELIVTPFLGV